MKDSSSRSWGTQIILYSILALVLLWTLVPLTWMVISSFKAPNAVTSTDIFFAPSLENYRQIFSGADSILFYARNSLLAAGISTIISVVLGCVGGYGLSRTHFRGKHHLSFWIISTRMAPIAAVIVPLFLIFRYVDLLGSIWSLVVAYLTFNLPFAIWIMSSFFDDLPEALEESAMVDGATRFQAFWRIALPLTTPGIVTTAILCFLFAWNDYAFALTFAGPGSQTIPLFAAQLVTQAGIDWGALTAIGTVVVLPMIVAGLLVRRYLVEGLTLGAVKD